MSRQPRSNSKTMHKAIQLRKELTLTALEWDPKGEQFVGQIAKEANRLVAREMRKPYDYSFI